MKLPIHVEEVKAHFVNTKDERLETMRILTEPKDLQHEESIGEMWEGVFRAEKKLNGAKTNDWVDYFINAVIASKKKKPYFSMNKAERIKKLKDIETYSELLKELYMELGLDSSDLIYGFDLFDENDERITDIDSLPAIGISEALDFYKNMANDEVGGYLQVGKLDDRYFLRSFIRSMASRNLARYEKKLLSVLGATTFVVYEKEVSLSDISNFLNGRKPMKN